MKIILDCNLQVTPEPHEETRFNHKTRTVYKPSETKYYQDKIRSAVSNYYTEKPTKNPVEMNLLLLLPIPVKFTPEQRQKALDGRIAPSTRRTGDCDNYEKPIQDAMNKLVYVDDSQIITKTCSKRYSDEPSILLQVIEFEEIEEHP